MPSASAPLVAADEIARFVGPAAAARGQEYSRNGAVPDITWDAEDGLLVGRVLGTAARPYHCRVTLVPSRAGFHRPTASTCTCPVGSDCKHAAATMFESNRQHVQQQLPAAVSVAVTVPEAPTWRTELMSAELTSAELTSAELTSAELTSAQLMSPRAGSAANPERSAPLGLLFELRQVATQRRHRWHAPTAATARAPIDPDAEYRLAVRPVIRADTGNWVRGGVTWNSMSYQGQRLGLDPTQHRWFAQFAALARSTREMFDLQESEWLYLDDFESGLLWHLLDDADRAGIRLVSGKKATDVRVGSAAEVGLALELDGGIQIGDGQAADGGPVNRTRRSGVLERAVDDGPYEHGAGGRSLESVADGGVRDRTADGGPRTQTAGGGSLVLDTLVTVDGKPVPRGGARAIGTHGIYVAEFRPRPSFLLAPTVDPLSDEQRRILRRPAVRIPPSDVDEFLTDFYPRLARTVAVRSSSVDLPELRPPELQLTTTFEPDQVLRLEWAWLYDGVALPIENGADAAGPGSSAVHASDQRDDHVGERNGDGDGGAPGHGMRDGIVGGGVGVGGRGAPDGQARIYRQPGNRQPANRPGNGLPGNGVPDDRVRGRVRGGGMRDPRTEAALLHQVRSVVGELAPRPQGDTHSRTRPNHAARTRLTGIEAAEFVAEVLPPLRELPFVQVVVVGDQPDYRELTDTPHLTITATETDRRDWFDLGVIVTVEGKSVPFALLFAALSKGRKKLLLADSSYLSLQHPAFDELKRLIDEASQIGEWETGPRISRYQADLWSEFEDLADETVAAQSWRAAARGLLDAGSIERVPVPAGVAAQLRPYQRDGLDWLVFLRRHGLGGILADDMGLGKTLQTLALIAEARGADVDQGVGQGVGQRAGAEPETAASAGAEPETAADAGAEPETGADARAEGREAPHPFLVVAPTSVVSNWANEAARYTPGLEVRSITATEGKTQRSVRDAADGADIVVTSYALFRLDFAAYQGVRWGGLVLDEAQFVKNPDSRAHRCALDLDAPVKIALTGTPLENSLVDLWALFAIVAPGLFPSKRRFTEEYVVPIGRGDNREHAAERTAKLRRRIRPLMMRRTKEHVASELPAKQEQALHVDLDPRHRALYDTHLQRERQKLLGLVDDLDRNRFIVFRSLTLLRMLSLDASLIDDDYAGIPSAKLDALLEQLDDVVAEGHRALVFSQFTSFLKLAAARLDAAGIAHEYLDGSTRRRASVIDAFRNGVAPVFLISLKAGGFGLNLTEADYVFLLDPWWNPASESQAVDRTHRIGQTKPVNVYRMVSSGTIEEKVMALRDRKAALFDAVMEDDAVFSSALTADDIRGLLQD